MSSEEAGAPPPVRQSVLRRTFGRSSTTAPQVSGYEDHFSLQAPTTVVRFQDSKSAARVIYNEGSQLVLEEQYDRETKKRHISIKQMEEESSGSLSILRGTYTTVGFFFAGFLVAFSLQIILFVICDLAINAGYTGLQSATWGWAMGIIFSFPLLIHGLSLANMLAGFFILDLWRGHPLFKKFILAGVRSEIVEWIFLVGFLLAPFTVMGACLVAKTDDWWQITSLYWFASVFAFYLIFITSVTFYESRVFLNVAFRSQDGSTMDRFLASLMLRKKHSLSGYSRTTYASFGSPEAAMNIDPSAERQYVVKGSLQENRRSIYSRFTQLSFVQGVLYETQESFPQRMFSVDDITGKRPYETSYSWGLERHFCKPRKTRYIGILRGPGAITSTQFKSSIACAFVGVFLLYFLIAGILTYTGFKWSFVGLVLVVLILLSLPFCLRPCILQGQLGRLRALKQEWKQRGSVVLDPNAIPADLMEQNNIEDDVKTGDNVTSPPDVEADATKTEIKEEPVATDDTKHKGSLTPTAVVGERIEHVISNVKKRVGFDDHKNETYSFETEWKGFSKAKTDMSMGVYNVSEKYRITQPTKGFIIFSLLVELVIFIIYPTLALYMIESWQLATLYLALALMSTFRHFTNSEALLQETGKLHSADNKTSSEASTWESESRLSQIAGTLSRGKAYQAWRVIFWIFALGLFGLGGMAVTTKTESSWNNGFTPVNDFYYDPVDSLHYATCALEKNVGGNIPLTLADYTLLSTQTYRSADVAPAELEQWFGIDVVVEHPEIVEEFRKDEFPVVPVTYKLFTGTGEESQYAVVSIRGSQNAWYIRRCPSKYNLQRSYSYHSNPLCFALISQLQGLSRRRPGRLPHLEIFCCLAILSFLENCQTHFPTF